MRAECVLDGGIKQCFFTFFVIPFKRVAVQRGQNSGGVAEKVGKVVPSPHA